MSEQTSAPADDLATLLTDAGPDAFALAYADVLPDPVEWEEAAAPAAGETRAARAAGRARIEVREVVHGQREALRRWLQLDDGTRPLTIFSADGEELREHPPGDLAAPLVADAGDPDRAKQVTLWLSSWLYRRAVDAPQQQVLGWVAAAAAWSWHMQALAAAPLPDVLASALTRAGERDEATENLVTGTGESLTPLLQRLPQRSRPRQDMVEDFKTLRTLSAAVPELEASAEWLLDQIALRDREAQLLRAVLEPDITDHLRDRLLTGSSAPALDAPRADQVAQARTVVRAYTAAVCMGHAADAARLLDAFPPPLHMPDRRIAGAWRKRSVSAQQAVDTLAARRDTATAEHHYLEGPERLHAENTYLAAWEIRLRLMHEALGRIADPAPVPPGLPEGLAEVTTELAARRVAEAFGSTARALAALDGQIAYLQQPAPAHRRAETAAETALLQAVRSAAAAQPSAEPSNYDPADITQRLHHAMPDHLARSGRRTADPNSRPRHAAPQPIPPPQPGVSGVRP